MCVRESRSGWVVRIFVLLLSGTVQHETVVNTDPDARLSRRGEIVKFEHFGVG
jgi:hypothetical protein